MALKLHIRLLTGAFQHVSDTGIHIIVKTKRHFVTENTALRPVAFAQYAPSRRPRQSRQTTHISISHGLLQALEHWYSQICGVAVRLRNGIGVEAYRTVFR